jgi:hypothetical protein
MAQLNIVLNQAPGGTLNAVLGSPGPQGPAGPQGPKGDPGQPGVIPAWGSITGTLSNQTDLQSALDGKYPTSNPAGYISSWTGGTITSDIHSSNGSSFRTWDGAHAQCSISPNIIQIWKNDPGTGALSIESDGITFQNGTLKQVEAYPGTIILNGYAQESWVTAQLIPYATQTWSQSNFYPLTANPAGYITASALNGYATQSWVGSNYYPLNSNPANYLINGSNGTVPAGGTTGQVLSKASDSNYALIWSDIPQAGVIWGTITGTLSDQTDLQSALDSKLSLSGGAMTGNITASSPYSNSYLSADFLSIQHPTISGYYSEHNVNGFIAQNEYGRISISGNSITFPDNSVQATAWTGQMPAVVWGSITGTLSDQTDLQSSLDSKIDFDVYGGIRFPYGYVQTGQSTQRIWFNGNYGKFYYDTASQANNAFASESWVNDRLSNYYPNSNPSGFITSSALTPYLTITNAANTYQTISGMSAYATQSFVTSQGYITSSALTPYAQLSGATFTGKINLATIAGTQTPSLNLGGTVDPNATNAVSGDFWISNAASPKVSYKVGSSIYYCTTNNLTNTFSAPQVFDTTSNTLAAVRITQKGTFPALVVEDSTNPDTTAFVVDQNGAVGVGVDPSTFSPTNKVEVAGSIKAASITFNGTAQFKVNGTQTNPFGSGNMSHSEYPLEILMSFNGSTYAIPMRLVSTP